MLSIQISPSRSRKARQITCLLMLTVAGSACASQDDAASRVAEDEGWPRQYVADDGMAVTVHQPQVDSWVDHTSIVFRAAVSFTPEDRSEPVFGALRIRADTDTDLENRRVLLGNMEVAESKLPTFDEVQATTWTARLDRDANARIEGSRRAGEFKSRPPASSPRSRPRGGRQLRGRRGI